MAAVPVSSRQIQTVQKSCKEGCLQQLRVAESGLRYSYYSSVSKHTGTVRVALTVSVTLEQERRFFC